MKVDNQKSIFEKLNPEQKVLVSVCSLPNTTNHSFADQFLKEPICWDNLILLCERHKLIPIFYHSLKEFSNIKGIEIPLTLKEKFTSQTQNVLKLAGEGVRISEAFSNERVPVIMLKGAFLSERLYSNLALRPSRDIDILVNPSNIDIANEILMSSGYKRVYPDFELSRKQKQFYQKYKNQYAYRNLKNGTLVELHWRLFSSNHLFKVPIDDIFNESRELVVASKPVRVLSARHEFQHLSIHGSMHQWFRLLWLRDYAQLICNEADGINEAIAYSKKYGTERSIEQAVRLSNLFFGSPLPNSLTTVSRKVHSLIDTAEKAIICDEQRTLSRKISRLRIPFYKMKIARGFRYKISCWTLLYPSFDEWKSVKFPDRFFFLYFLLRPFLWFYSVYLKKKIHHIGTNRTQ